MFSRRLRCYQISSVLKWRRIRFDSDTRAWSANAMCPKIRKRKALRQRNKQNLRGNNSVNSSKTASADGIRNVTAVKLWIKSVHTCMYKYAHVSCIHKNIYVYKATRNCTWSTNIRRANYKTAQTVLFLMFFVISLLIKLTCTNDPRLSWIP